MLEVDLVDAWRAGSGAEAPVLLPSWWRGACRMDWIQYHFQSRMVLVLEIGYLGQVLCEELVVVTMYHLSVLCQMTMSRCFLELSVERLRE